MHIAIIGASGTIGRAFTEYFLEDENVKKLYLFSRSHMDCKDKRAIHTLIDIENEISVQNSATIIPENHTLDIVIVTTGMLFNEDILPEKSINNLSYSKFIKLYSVNVIGPALVAKYFMPKLRRRDKAIFAVLSARVSSISDNILGGWYSYRCAKTALNMLVKNLSIEMNRKNKNLIIVGLHPGTVDSKLSKPFSTNLDKSKIFTACYSVSKMIPILFNLKNQDSGNLFAWDGKKINF